MAGRNEGRDIEIEKKKKKKKKETFNNVSKRSPTYLPTYLEEVGTKNNYKSLGGSHHGLVT